MRPEYIYKLVRIYAYEKGISMIAPNEFLAALINYEIWAAKWN